MTPKSGLKDGMRIEWDVPIRMDDGLVLRALSGSKKKD
jgi:hypothetical protein